MPIPIRELTPSVDGRYQILTTDDGSRTLVDLSSNDAFHSECGALTETKHVYLNNSGVIQRMESRRATSILEVGIGTGMALLCSLDASIAQDTPLAYVGLETQWVSSELLRQLAPQTWVDQPAIVESYLNWRSSFPTHVIEGTYVWEIDQHRRATIHIGDALNWTPAVDERYDAIYFDPFAPASASKLWSRPMLSKMRGVLKQDGRFVTYCVNRQVRDSLVEAGFQVTRVAGPVGGKREVLLATVT